MRTCHLFNVAQNAYNVAKGLRALGEEADSFDAGGGNSMAHPAWEDAWFSLREGALTLTHWDWEHADLRTGPGPDATRWERPPWAKILGNDAGDAWYERQADYQADLARLLAGEAMPVGPLDERKAFAHAALAESHLTAEEQESLWRDAFLLPALRSVLRLTGYYDLIVLYGRGAVYGALLPADRPYVCLEHATLRDVPPRRDAEARLLVAAYQHADAVIVTNADCKRAADALGLTNAVFIPHPLDTQKFSPGEGGRLREELLKATGAELLCYAPARHSGGPDGCKQNEVFLRGFARYVAEAEACGAPRAVLLLSAWGDHVPESAAVIKELGIGSRVRWLACLPKRKLVALYRAADIVLDQFDIRVGSFGTVTAEALACGKPVITYLNVAAHHWCGEALPEAPPVASASAADEIFDWLDRLARIPAARAAMGHAARRWIERWHTNERVARMHRDLYAEILARRAAAVSLSTAAAPAAGLAEVA